MSKTKKIIVLLSVFALLFSLAACGAKTENPGAEKTITVKVVHGDGGEKELSVVTSAENLRDALEAEGLIAGDESAAGLFVKTVDGETADEDSQEWWCITRDGEQLNSGVDGAEIADGEHYEFTLTAGW